MASHTTVIIDWRGPYLHSEIIDNPEWGNGLYLVTGKQPYEREATIQYCGITEGSYVRRFNSKHKAFDVTKEQEFWLGAVTYPDNASRHFLEIAESIIIYFWQPALNERKKAYPPTPITLMNKWFKKDGTPRMRQHSMCKDLSDVISWDGELWRSGNLQVW
ncbi:hypothetical protein ACS91J_13150 [Pectobacterium carotovorum]|uniref:hypothetical protein n=1 Tax=Pectobacterium odoriferum TaxID=78398 RepID=UPI0013743E79|nr:hypothetical protein [Pectobacterium odoriferum]QHP80246.1 hypothetical protein EO763_10095 [Pectobacterium odoriferum]GKW01747.1 hypothetical protein PEC301877_05620 [Pectobacterium carotovorum subsp. carotovorum]GKX42579.1 hypothetical protein SOASR015_16130 [Pectobacterium carotovorum subsp. carotovorum]GLX57090.1 hypothetical protein Pcaca02_23990 [Pectobacterium carotovorum subsp. carotovorum]